MIDFVELKVPRSLLRGESISSTERKTFKPDLYHWLCVYLQNILKI